MPEKIDLGVCYGCGICEEKDYGDKYVSRFEKRGHFGPELNFEIVICTEIIGIQLSFTACFMFIAAWIHFLCLFIETLLVNCETEKITVKY